MVPKWGLCDPPGKSYILPIHRNGRGQTGKFRSPNIFWSALESFVLPLSITYLKMKRADGFAGRLRLALDYKGKHCIPTSLLASNDALNGYNVCLNGHTFEVLLRHAL